MNEFRAELDRRSKLRFVACPQAPADPVARLEQQHRLPGADQLGGGAQPGRAGTDHDHVSRRGRAQEGLPGTRSASPPRRRWRAGARCVPCGGGCE